MAGDDAEWFGELYEANRGRVYGYLARRGVPADDIPDLVSEVFTIAWRRVAELGNDADPVPWLLTTARNVAFGHARGLQRRELLATKLEGFADSWQSSDTGFHDDVDSRRIVWVALSRLSEYDKELLLLTAWDGLTPAQAAKSMGLSRGSVRVRLHRARKRIASAMQELEPDPVNESATVIELPTDSQLRSRTS